MRDKIVFVMASVFGFDDSEISDKIVLGQTKFLDSLKHMILILALEDEFEVRLSDEEVTEMLSLPLILEILSTRLARSD